jgi:hypothetical protein
VDPLAKIRQARADFGLDTSDEIIAQAAREDPSPGMRPPGVPVTTNEQAEMDRREKIADSIHALTEAAETGQFPELGSVAVSQKTGAVTIGLVGEHSAAQARVRTSLPIGTAIRFTSVPVSWKRLHDLQAAIDGTLAKGPIDGLKIVSVDNKWGADEVEVTVDRQTPLSKAVAALTQRFGDEGLHVVSGPATPSVGPALTVDRYAFDGAAVGGQRISTYAVSGAFVGDCTLTGGARNPTNGQLWLITAGHCSPAGGLIFHGPWLTSNGYLGQVVASATWDYSSTMCDCAAIPAGAGLVNNFILDAYNNLDGVVANVAPSYYGPGVGLCYSGASSGGVRCGTMIDGWSYTQTLTFPGMAPHSVYIYDLVRNSMPVCLGDSGSPAVNGAGTTWLGLVSGYYNGGSTFKSYADPYNTSGWTCYSNMLLSKSTRMVDYYGISMITYDP